MIDTSALLASRPVDIPAAQIQAQSLANLGTQNQLQKGALAQQPGELALQQAQITAAQQDAKQRQMQIDQTQKVNDAYAQAFTPGEPGAPPTLDTGKLQTALATHNAGSAIPGLMKGIVETQAAVTAAAAQRAKLATDQADLAGGIGKTVKDAGYSPQLMIAQAQHAIASGAIDPAVGQPIVQELTQALQADPTGAQAKALAQQLADHLISASPGQQKLIAEQQTSQSKADEDARKADQEYGQMVSNAYVNVKNQRGLDAANKNLASKLPAKYLNQLVTNYDDGLQVQTIANSTMTADQKAMREQAAAALKNTEGFQNRELGIRQQEVGIAGARLGMEQKKAAAAADPLAALSANDQAIAAKLASGDLNSTQLSRMKNKEAILAGAIQINPAWSNETFNTKDAFTNPQKQQAQNLGTISRIVGHIGRFEQNSAALGTAPLYAAGVNLTGQQNAVNDDAHAIAAELEKLTSGGVGSIGQTQEWIKALHSPSQAARQKSIHEISKLIGSQYEGMNQTYKAAIGSDLPIGKYVSPDGQAWMKANGIDVGTPASAPGGAPPAAVHGIPDLGSTFNGGKVTKVTRIN